MGDNSRDLINFKGKRKLLLSSNLLEERQIAEAPWMMYKNGFYYLFYSSGWFLEAKYHMRVARGKKATGPFIKRNKPILSTDWERYNKVSFSGIRGEME